MDEPHGRRAAGDGDEPSHRPGRRWRRLAVGGLLAAGCGGLALAALLALEPEFYRSRAAAAPPGGAEPLARRLVTKAAALRADFLRPGDWGTAVTEAELNAWLATDLPRNHPQLLPPQVSEPRVAFGPRRIRVGGRLAVGPVGCVGSFEAEVALRAVNQVGIVVEAVRLGGLPLPAGPVVRELARRCADLGLPTEVRRLDGRTVLVVYTSPISGTGAPSHWLESLAVEEGELLVAGTTKAADASRP